ncbi:hypothetical protein [Desulfovibrio sp. UIB00]|uniref:hypothetical protein n=1 Tax=Desulfovibrio sp. UIB00 TaxID=2804314 RepID=UPI001F0F5E9A|nr:hypothetical protein [Desulfovibrio sp. UIB00]
MPEHSLGHFQCQQILFFSSKKLGLPAGDTAFPYLFAVFFAKLQLSQFCLARNAGILYFLDKEYPLKFGTAIPIQQSDFFSGAWQGVFAVHCLPVSRYASATAGCR